MSRTPISIITSLLLSGALWSQAPAIRVVQDMSFGDLVVDEQGGGIALTPEGTLVPYSGAVAPVGRSLVQEARFVFTGPPKARFQFMLTPPTPLLTAPMGSRIRVESIQYPATGNQGVFDAQGQAVVRLGAKLDIPTNTPSGIYVMRQMNIQLTLTDGDSSKSVNQEFALSVKVRPTLRLVNLASLDFGSLIPGSATGKYFVTAGSGAHGDIAGGPRQFRGNPRPAEFILSGSRGVCYSIELPKLVLLNGPGAPLEIQDFNCNVPLQATVPAGGLRFQVGASLMIPSDQMPGLYRGTFTVSVDYP